MASAEDHTPEPPKSAAEPAVTLPPAPFHWPSAAMAYYSAAGAPAFFAPHPVWDPQQMAAMPYGTHIPYPHMYYGMSPVVYPSVETKSGEGGGKVVSGSADDNGSHSAESETEGTSGTRDESGELQDKSRKRTLGAAFADGENSQPTAGSHSNGTSAVSSYSGKVSKLPVSAPGRTALAGLPTNLSIGMDSWKASSHVGAAVKGQPNTTLSTYVAPSAVMPEHHQWNETELKREKRKQSNRESARRSRIRKQQECEDLGRQVAELNSENTALKIELEQLLKVKEDLEKENASIMEKLNTRSNEA